MIYTNEGHIRNHDTASLKHIRKMLAGSPAIIARIDAELEHRLKNPVMGTHARKAVLPSWLKGLFFALLLAGVALAAYQQMAFDAALGR